MCSARIWGDVSGLVCTLDDNHLPGHVFAASWAPDSHTDGPADD